MNTQVQIIEKNGKPEFAVIPYERFQRLLQLAEDAEDIAAAEKVLSNTHDELVPHEVVERLVVGNDHPLRIWREYRGITQDTLAQKAGIGKSYISQIESGKKPGSVRVLSRIAEHLNVDVDDLLV